jgi:hypothetical protein
MDPAARIRVGDDTVSFGGTGDLGKADLSTLGEETMDGEACCTVEAVADVSVFLRGETSAEWDEAAGALGLDDATRDIPVLRNATGEPKGDAGLSDMPFAG